MKSKRTKFSKIYYTTKKLNILLILVMIFLSFTTGCNHETQIMDDGFSIVTVNFVQYDFARAVCGNDEDITMIMKPGAEIHGFEPSLANIETIANADVFIYNGGESDSWIESILNSIDTKNVKTLALMNHAVLIEDKHEGHSHAHLHEHNEHNHSDDNGICETKSGYDEHIWTSPQNAVLMVNAICNSLCEAKPEMANVYRKNASEYIAKIDKIHHEISDVANNSESDFIVMGDKFPFLYFVHEYDLKYMAAFPGCSHENDASPSVIIDIIETMNEKNIKYVFYTESSDGKMADTICRETGAQKLLLHSCQTINREDFENGKTYVDIMYDNAKNLKEALS